MFPANAANSHGAGLRGIGSIFELSASTSSAGVARAHVRSALAGLDRHRIEIAELLVSELVTNAVAHAHSAPLMRIDVADQDVQVVVQDDAPGPVVLQDAAEDAPGGRGLLLVDSLATSWGWTPTADGKRVWFTL